MYVDLNADLGEGITDDAGLLAVVTSANVACGFHAGDVATMHAVCRDAARRGVTIGAQVSYADREDFGRRAMDVASSTLKEWVAEQVTVLEEIARSEGTRVGYLKPHGALYHRVVDDADQARAVLAGSGELPVLGLPGAVILALAQDDGRATYTEGFPDRGYTPEGRLVPRSEPGALVSDTDEITVRAVRLAHDVDSVCLHGDSPAAVARTTAVRRALEAAGLRVAAFVPSTGTG